MSTITYTAGSDLPDWAITWLDSAKTPIDFSSGWTFELKVGTPGSAAALTKATGFTGAATAPNLVVAWATTGELNTLTPGIYGAQVKATRTADSKQRFLTARLVLLDAIT